MLKSLPADLSEPRKIALARMCEINEGQRYARKGTGNRIMVIPAVAFALSKDKGRETAPAQQWSAG